MFAHALECVYVRACSRVRGARARGGPGGACRRHDPGSSGLGLGAGARFEPFRLGGGLFQQDWEVVDGHIDLPTKPGLGFEIDETAVAQHTQYREELGGEYYYETDGSVADW